MAAEQGEIKAVFVLGAMFHEGRGVTRNYQEAMKRYRRVAEKGTADQGSLAAQFALGFMYLRGEGVPQDYVRAHFWYNVAAAGGVFEAEKARDNLAKRMTHAQIAQAQQLASDWWNLH